MYVFVQLVQAGPKEDLLGQGARAFKILADAANKSPKFYSVSYIALFFFHVLANIKLYQVKLI